MSPLRTQLLKSYQGTRSMPVSEGHLMFSAALFITGLDANRGGAAAQAAKGSRHTALLHAYSPFQHSSPIFTNCNAKKAHWQVSMQACCALHVAPEGANGPLTWELCLREPVDLKPRLSLTMLPSL